MDNRPRKDRPGTSAPRKKAVPPKNQSTIAELAESFRDEFSRENLRLRATVLRARLKSSVRNFGVRVFYARERILCGVVAGAIMVFLALLQTTVFSTLRPFGAIPDLMLIFTLALSMSEGGKWGAVWGIVAAVIIEALGSPDVTLLPLLYMPVGYFCGNLCTYYFTGSAAVRAVFTLAVLPLRGIFTALYMVLSPLYATAGEIFFDVVLPEVGATLLLAAPIHLLTYLCLRPFHRTRAEMVAEK